MSYAKLPYCRILDTDISVTNMDKTVAWLEDNLDELRGEYICVSNVHTTEMSYRDTDYRAVQNGGAALLPDGKPLSYVSRRRGFPEAERVAGPDLMPRIFRLSEEKGYRNYFYGSTQETLDILRTKLAERYPKMTICGMFSPPYYKTVNDIPPDVDSADIERIREARPDFIWIGLGAPKQEQWMAMNRGKLPGVMIGVGAGFDFHAGTVRRAPKWMQESYLEWLYRILQDPHRLFKRYVSTNFSFVIDTSREGHVLKKTGRRGAASSEHVPGMPDSQTGIRIAMIGHKRIPSREGGIEVVVDNLATRLVKGGDGVTAYDRRSSFDRRKPKPAKEYAGIRIINIPTMNDRRLNAIVYSILGSIRLIFEGCDVAHYHAEGPCIMLWLPKLFGIPTVVTIHGLDWQRAKWGNFASKMLKKGEKRAAIKADEIIVLSKNLQQYFLDTYGRETIYIPNGIDRPERVPVDEIRSAFGLEKDGYILFLARLVPEKGIHYLINAFKGIRTDKKLVIAGGQGSAEDYVKEITELSKDDPRIIFTNFVHDRLLEELYSNCYMFVLPSDVEGMALSLLEAMSYGTCCVISDIPENVEVTGDHAVTFPKGNTEALRETMTELVNSPDKVRDYASKSQDYVCGRFNWDDVTARTREIYLKAIDKHKKK